MSEKYKLGPVTAYGIAVEHGFQGTEQEWLESLHPSDAQIEKYFNNNPAQRVMDGSVTKPKLSGDVQRWIDGLRESVGSPLTFKGAVASEAALPTEGMENGDMYYAEAEMKRYAWSETEEDWVGLPVDESVYTDNLRAALDGAIKEVGADPSQMRISINHYLNTADGLIKLSSQAAAGTAGACFAFIAVRAGDVIAPASGYQQRVCAYHYDGTSYVFDEALTGAGYYRATSLTITEDCYIRYGFRREDQAVMEEDEAAGAVTVTRKYPASDSIAVEDLIDRTAEVDTRNWYADAGGEPEGHNSKGFAEVGPIPVSPGGRYTMSAVFTRDDFYQDTSYNRVRVYAKDGTLLETKRFSWTAAAGATSYYYYDLILSDAAAWIVINYAKWATDLRLTGPASRDPVAWQQIARLKERVEAIEKTSCAIRQNNPQMIREFVDVAVSYLHRTDPETGLPMLQYGSPTVLDQGYAEDGKIDCSAYVGMVLRGIDFDSSIYATGIPEDAWIDPPTEGDDGDDDDEGTAQYDPFVNAASPRYAWAINPYEWNVRRNPDQPSSIRPVRVAAQIAQWMAERGQEIPIDTYYDNLEPGDVVFYSRLSEKSSALPGEHKVEGRYRKINHCAILISKLKVPRDTYDSNGNEVVFEEGVPTGARDWDGNVVPYSGSMWDTSTYPWLHRFVHVNNVWGACETGVLEKGGSTKGNNINTLKMCCRPDLGAMAAPAEWAQGTPVAEDYGPGGYLKYDDNYLYVHVTGGWKKIPLQAI